MKKHSRLLRCVLSAILVLVMTASFFPVAVLAEGEPIVRVSSITSHPGETVSVTIDLINNPGVAAANIIDADFALYAHWTPGDILGWTPASEIPSDAQIVEEKWTYTLTSNTESTAPSMSGWTQTGNYWKQTGSGSTNYASFPRGFDTGHSIYKSFAKSAYNSYDNGSTKRTVNNAWAGYVYWHWMYDCGGGNGIANRAILDYKGTGPDNGFYYKYFGAFTSTTGNYSNDKYYCNSRNITNYIIPGRTAYSECQGATRWFRFDYYRNH